MPTRILLLAGAGLGPRGPSPATGSAPRTPAAENEKTPASAAPEHRCLCVLRRFGLGPRHNVFIGHTNLCQGRRGR